ncbi:MULTISPECIES: DUF6525 family protein [Marivita]|uniref:Uncharacterized protein n=1 Tax=Marivita cryptomonadis TaxID=505252 RepID=A0A9Q2P4L2_9RHOB|nr:MULTISPECIES: DUF6525 family protein [Marivita]MCR9167735.1 DUF6525 family protein [Paracoccaceae bacterium]MBM2322140.1 hypothetical protein [Marivita cryptomonadis]MBM2331721.1 hypothetical protein [Marivita cryptomonadis]MBM2341306.1 hypothetical protein [Marivita cryptomonadis]MBM2345969.1 hypothetical protein [Marivita cryptomonadis]
MSHNRGKTSLKLTRRQGQPMREYDRLPSELRQWLTTAVLPWRPASVKRAFDRAFIRTRDARRALEELDDLQARLIAKDVRRVWGPDHPMLADISSAEQHHHRTEYPRGRSA